MNRLRDEQRRRNQACRACWDLYQPHRERVTHLLLTGAEEPAGTLCVLGAGNCNDLDLERLTRAFREIQLVDLDGPTLAAGVAAQPLAARDRLVLHGDVDVTGISDVLAPWSPASPPDASLVRQLVTQAATARPIDWPAPFDVVASVCLLSQLIEAVSKSLGEAHPQYLALLFAVRARHLQLLVEWLRPGGRAVLVTDFVSSATCSELARADEADLPALTARLVQQRNFFTGLNPWVLQALVRQDPWFAARVAQVRLVPPWRWPFPTRVYAVCALEISKKTER